MEPDLLIHCWQARDVMAADLLADQSEPGDDSRDTTAWLWKTESRRNLPITFGMKISGNRKKIIQGFISDVDTHRAISRRCTSASPLPSHSIGVEGQGFNPLVLEDPMSSGRNSWRRTLLGLSAGLLVFDTQSVVGLRIFLLTTRTSCGTAPALQNFAQLICSRGAKGCKNLADLILASSHMLKRRIDRRSHEEWNRIQRMGGQHWREKRLSVRTIIACMDDVVEHGMAWNVLHRSPGQYPRPQPSEASSIRCATCPFLFCDLPPFILRHLLEGVSFTDAEFILRDRPGSGSHEWQSWRLDRATDLGKVAGEDSLLAPGCGFQVLVICRNGRVKSTMGAGNSSRHTLSNCNESEVILESRHSSLSPEWDLVPVQLQDVPVNGHGHDSVRMAAAQHLHELRSKRHLHMHNRPSMHQPKTRRHVFTNLQIVELPTVTVQVHCRWCGWMRTCQLQHEPRQVAHFPSGQQRNPEQPQRLVAMRTFRSRTSPYWIF
ncbi:uncharacterized protein MYCFIDRAFT_180477 [Pseudocercospora fijiensis CIRAD86]|uniref:Uncharacterized protein n=1 Tax=Pseudocercospora fijiensis (strain CIRAD86) TaxID=383855 RepID=M3AIF9_PSEFD|nr:uncharacterized protein MYCFIDRAFT_180477 [Pseudocercospora fijiensis CIRAD86]EME76993.1 hypothetical protein MYCFIDRAFT_180477 [Pseudocercospora fijiensis CIRAD86]